MATHRGFSAAITNLFASVHAQPTLGAAFSLIDQAQLALGTSVDGGAAENVASQTSALVPFATLARLYQPESD